MDKNLKLILIIATCYLIIYIIYSFPFKYKLFVSRNCSELDVFNINYFKTNFKNHDILISYSPSNSIDMDTTYKKVKLSEYIDNYIRDKNYYFKTEDQYNFLNEIGLEKRLLTIFRNNFKHSFRLNDRLSFWLGGKGSTTSFHVDIEDISYLYVIEGKKKVILISPIYYKYMYPVKKYYHYAIYSQIDFKNIDYNKYPLFKKVKSQEIILNEGDCLLIPRNWWHAIENIEDTLAISYKIYRPIFIFFGILPELVRRLKSTDRGSNYIWNHL